MDDTHIFGCSRSGDELFAIGRSLRAAVAEDLVERDRTPDGLRLRIGRQADTISAMREFVRREQECCSFFDFTVHEDDDALTVMMTGPPQAAPLLDLLYQLAEPTTG